MTGFANGPSPVPLRRVVGVWGATMMGLGSIIGTGIFVSIGIATESAGPAVVLAIIVAALVATCNGLSSAQLAAAHPVSGGTYEYGYRRLHPALGFTAGWMFVCAKSASAATAALGFAGYSRNLVADGDSSWRGPLAVATVVLLTVLVLSGLKRSNIVNIVIVLITLISLTTFVVAGLPLASANMSRHFTPFFASPDGPALPGLLEACALMFVAYTGYGRIATLGEEIIDPRKNIPRAILVTLLVSALLYVAVAVVGIAAVGAEAFAEAGTKHAATLQVVAHEFPWPAAGLVVSVGAMTAMLGVLLNLILGISRVVLAMGRRRDLPPVFSRLDRSESTPYVAVIFVGIAISGLCLLGSVKTTWSFSAFAVLVYYALTNLSAIRMNDEERLFPRSVAWAGLCSCLFLAFWVEQRIWLTGLGLIASGLCWWFVARKLARDNW